MSDKNAGHNGAQWTKAAAATAAALAAQQKPPPHNLAGVGAIPQHQHQQQLYNTPNLMPAHTPLFGVGAHAHAHTHPGAIAPYVSARFHPPIPPPQQTQSSAHHAAAIQHAGTHQSLPPATHAHTTVLTAPSSASPNVPAQSGFVPPSLLPAAAVAAATSVLTPNPFVVTEQFSHLNAQQHLNKIMSAMQQHANAASGSSMSSGSGNSASQQQSQSTPAAVRQNAVELPLGSGGSSSGAASAAGSAAAAGGSASVGAINAVIAENVLSAISAAPNSSLTASVPAVHGRLMGIGVKVPDDEKLRRIQHVVESGVGESAKQQILQILDRISTLKPVEKLLLYLRLPGDAPETDPLRHPQNPLGTRSEINHTINWVRSHLEHDPKVSIPKQDVYNDYLAYCDRLDIKPLSTADFGKVMKQVFPGIRPRRLGTRGHSRYCYAAMRKTTKLMTPQVPQIDSASVAQTNEAAGGSGSVGAVHDAPLPAHSGDAESWEIVKKWAEHLLHSKVNSVQELATRIKDAGTAAGSSGSLDVAVGAVAAHGRTTTAVGTHLKKYTPREPKEKRHLVDIGPLKKRRKKKRKGSSSSESSCSQQPQQQNASPTASQSQLTSSSSNNNNNNDYQDLSLIRSTASYAADDTSAHNSIELVQVKQEVLDSPNLQHLQHTSGPPQLQSATIAESYLPQQQQHQQLLPMNLATEQRTVLAQTPPTTSAFGAIRPQQLRTAFSGASHSSSAAAAVKNLTPKIIELSAATGTTPTVAEQATTIKEEDLVDDYNPNIFCKKVRKAQQTKGFWTNSPTAPSNVVPIITTTPPSVAPAVAGAPAVVGSTPVIAAAQAAAHTTTNAVLAPAAAPPTGVGVVSPSFLMGPPAQITSHTSTSPSNALLGDGSAVATTSLAAASPKVASRNTMQLRAKRQQLAAAAAAAAAAASADAASGSGGLPDADAADLPSNLGLPRERVISICNMDKHELDDYLMTGEEEEDQEDQETELLQYFQTGDAEEKPNSLDAAKNRNPTATVTTITATAATLTQQMKTPTAPQPTSASVNGAEKAVKGTFATTTVSRSQVISISSFVTATTTVTTSTTPAVGSASASLALMSQKHQQHQRQRQNQPQMQRHGNNSSNNNKRKINLSRSAIKPTDMILPRKNCIFLPISPNINSVNVNAAGSCNSTSSSNSFFVSPGQGAQRVRPKPSFPFEKQLSLESDSSDPMIGACRRRRSYASLIPTSSSNFMPTSASAPPSPSVLQQQQQQQVYGSTAHFVSSGNSCLQTPTSITGDYSEVSGQSPSAAAAALLAADQNSLDLDLFGAAATAASTGMDYDELTLDELTTPLNETQRSQSVPLSQLQRIHSPAFNRSFQAAPYSACTSVVQTPVPHDFADSSTLFSENSSSQNSGGGAMGTGAGAILAAGDSAVAHKLEEAGVLGSDSTAIFDSMYVSDILPEDFVTKFPNIAQGNTTTTTCSSAGSSSGYSSSACTTFGSGALISGSGTITSRSVPSTPLPHQQQQSSFANFYGGGRRLDDDAHLSPITAAGSATFTTASYKYGSGGGSYDISRSMPTTPITTPRFRYSPTEFSREFLSNGNTIDSLISGGAGGTNGDGLANDGLSVALDGLNATDALIDESCGLSTDAFASNAVTDAASMMADTDLLDNL